MLLRRPNGHLPTCHHRKAPRDPAPRHPSNNRPPHNLEPVVREAHPSEPAPDKGQDGVKPVSARDGAHARAGRAQVLGGDVRVQVGELGPEPGGCAGPEEGGVGADGVDDVGGGGGVSWGIDRGGDG